MRCVHNRTFLLMIMIGLSYNAWSQGGSGRGGGRGAGGAGAVSLYNYDATAASGAAIPDAPPVDTHQKITLNGEAIPYTARAGYLPLRSATTGQAVAHLFFTCYTREGVSNVPARPVLFFLGGAPGISAAWQEFGGFGPKRMKRAADGTAGLPPYVWEENPNTLLGQADLVFVNPVGTGFSRPDQPARGPDFWNTAGDIASLGEFVRGFLNTYDRRNSPLFLAGEDFGTARAAGLANYLLERQITVHGVVLLSMTLSGDSIAGDEQYITLLPNLVMAAWFHKKLAPELQALSAGQIADQARQFAAREYLQALYKGARMTAEERTRVVANLSRLTGLSKAFIVNNDLRITLERFNTELLRDQRRAISLSDARVSGHVPASGGRGGGRGGGGGGGGAAIDYALSPLAGGFLTAYESYLRRELTFNGSSGIFYLSGGGIGTFTSTGSDDASLAAAFVRNPGLRLFVGVNFYDLNAPFYATEFTVAHLGVSPEIRAGNISISNFEAGQMAYIDNRALAKLHGDLAKFLSESITPGRK